MTFRETDTPGGGGNSLGSGSMFTVPEGSVFVVDYVSVELSLVACGLDWTVSVTPFNTIRDYHLDRMDCISSGGTDRHYLGKSVHIAVEEGTSVRVIAFSNANAGDVPDDTFGAFNVSGRLITMP